MSDEKKPAPRASIAITSAAGGEEAAVRQHGRALLVHFHGAQRALNERFLKRRVAASTSVAVSMPSGANAFRTASGTGARSADAAFCFDFRGIGTPHAMPHTQNS